VGICIGIWGVDAGRPDDADAVVDGVVDADGVLDAGRVEDD